jgi:hypothetical protein
MIRLDMWTDITANNSLYPRCVGRGTLHLWRNSPERRDGIRRTNSDFADASVDWRALGDIQVLRRYNISRPYLSRRIRNVYNTSLWRRTK